MDKDKELEKKQEGAIASRVSGGSGDTKIPAGFEGLEEGDIKIARLAIGQGLSQVVIDGKAKMGDLFNTISREVYGESIEFVPLFVFKTRAQFDIERGLVMLSRDNIKVTWGKDEFEEYIGQPVEELDNSQWQGKEPPLFSEVLNFPCLLANQLTQFPLCLSLMKTAYKEGLRFAGMARYTNEDFFARVYKISTRIEKGAKGTYALPVIEFVRRATDEEYVIAKKWFDGLYRRKVDIDVELEEEKTE